MSGSNNNFTQRRWFPPPPRSFGWPQEDSGTHGAFSSYPSMALRPVIYRNPSNNVFNGIGRLLDPWALTEGSIIAGPLFGSPSFLLPILDEVMTRDTPALPLEYIRDVGDDSRLALNEQNKASKKLRRVIYNPAPKRLTKRVSQYYKDGASKSSSKNMVKQEDDEDEMRCAICLDDFEAREIVLATPCDHMFHEDCIVPWVRSHGRCPVCRSSVSDQM